MMFKRDKMSGTKGRRLRRPTTGAFVIAATAMLCTPLWAQAPAKPAPGAPPKLPVDITANHQDFYNDDNKTIYTGDVEVIQGQDRMRTPQLTVFFVKKDPNAPAPKQPAGAPDSESRKIERMEAEGPVYFADDTQNGRGDHGVYTAADQTTVLTGNVVLVQGKNVSTGDKLVLHQDTNQAQLYSGNSAKRVRGVFYNDDAKVAPTTPGAAAPPAKPKKPARP
jgi:lipopolysaccharide export system protein LptA